MNEAVYLHPCDAGQGSGTTIKEELGWIYHTLGLLLPHTYTLVMVLHLLISYIKQEVCTMAE